MLKLCGNKSTVKPVYSDTIGTKQMSFYITLHYITNLQQLNIDQ